LVEGGTLEDAANWLKRDLLNVMFVNWMVWPFAVGINYALVPPVLQVPWINVVTVGWSAYLSAKAAQK